MTLKLSNLTCPITRRIRQLKNQWKSSSKCHYSQWNSTTLHTITNQNQWKNSDQPDCPALNGKVKWMKLTGTGTFVYINKYSKTEILAFCYWHNYVVIGLRVVQFLGDRDRNFKSASHHTLGQFEITCPITPWILLHSVLLPLLMIMITI